MLASLPRIIEQLDTGATLSDTITKVNEIIQGYNDLVRVLRETKIGN